MMRPTIRDRTFFRYLRRPSARRLAQVVHEYQSLVYATALRVTGNSEDAADICQDVFLGLLLEPPAPTEVRHPDGYLASRVVGRATNLRRADRRRKARERRGGELAREDGLSDDDRDVIHRELERLPEDLAAAVRLRYLAGLRNAQVARALGLSERAVEERLRRARERLRRRIPPLVFGALTGSGLLDASAEVPGLLAVDLKRLARGGGGLEGLATGTTGTTTVGMGALLMSKKVALAAGVTLLFLGAGLFGVSWGRWGGRAPDRPAPSIGRVPAVAPTIVPPEHSVDLLPNSTEGDRSATVKQPLLAALHGRVWDDEGDFVAGARVLFVQELDTEDVTTLRADGYVVDEETLRRETVSDEEGRYAIDGLLPNISGRFTLEKAPFMQCNRMLVARPRLSKEGREHNLVLCRRSRLFGQVTDPDGRAISGANVLLNVNVVGHLTERNRHGYWVAFPSDELGRYDTGFEIPIHDSIPHASPLHVLVLADGFALERARVARVHFTDHEAQFDITLRRGRDVHLLVQDLDDAPVPEARVEWGPSEHRFETTTDSGGKAKLRDLPRVSDPSWKNGVLVYVSKSGYFRLELKLEGELPETVEATLTPEGAAVEGEVVFDVGIPEAIRRRGNLQLEEWREKNERWGNGRDAPRSFDRESFRYRFRPRHPGRYRIRWEHGLLVWRSEPFDYHPRFQVRVDLPVRVRPPYLAGMIRDSSGRPAADAAITARFLRPGEETRSTWGRWGHVAGFHVPRRPGNATGTHTGENGEFLLLLPAEEFDFWHPDNRRASLVAGDEDIGWSADYGLDFTPSTVIEDLDLHLEPTGGVEGQVLAENGKPSIGEVVVASDCEGLLRWTHTGDDGRYRLDTLRPGSWLVEALGRLPKPAEGGGSGGGGTEGLPPPHEVIPRPVEILSGQVTRWDIDLASDRLGEIEGTIAGGEEFTNGVFLNYGMFWNGTLCPGPLLGGRQIVRTGSFTLKNLLPGTYRLLLTRRPFDETPLADTVVEVRRAQVARVVLAPVEKS